MSFCYNCGRYYQSLADRDNRRCRYCEGASLKAEAAEYEEPVSVCVPPAKIIQFQTVTHPGGTKCGPHIQIYALCDDGTMWVKYESGGNQDVWPSKDLWYLVSGKKE